MSIFENIRSQTNSTAARVLFVVVVLVFVFWGVGGNTGPRSTVYAEVNGKRITNAETQLFASQRWQIAVFRHW